MCLSSCSDLSMTFWIGILSCLAGFKKDALISTIMIRLHNTCTNNFTLSLFTAGRKVFREFLRSEYSEENMLFWLACEELKQEQSSEGVEEKARLIYEDYISILSPKEVNVIIR